MKFALDPHLILLVVAFAVSGFIVYRSWHYRGRPIVQALIASMSAVAWWSVCVAIEHISLPLSYKQFWVNMSYFGIVILPASWLAFTMMYTENERWLNWRLYVLLGVIPLASIVVVWTNPLTHLQWKELYLDYTYFPPDDVAVHGPWMWVIAGYSYALLLASLALFIGYYRKVKGHYRAQIRVLIAAMFVPWAANIIFTTGTSFFKLMDPTPFAFAITGMFFYWGLIRLQLLDIVPLAYSEIFHSMNEGVIVLDAQERVADINPAAQGALSVTRKNVLWRKLDDVFSPDICAALKSCPEPGVGGLFLGSGQKRLHYGIQVSEIKSRNNFSGHAVFLHEDTQAVLLANTDGLTGLYNKRYFLRIIDQEIARSSRQNTSFSMLMLDLDFFKAYNDNYGHQAGDALLVEVGRCLINSIRAMDTAFRYGGEEFAILLPATSPDESLTVAERIRKGISQIEVPGTGKITASIGISSFPDDGTVSDSIIARSDAALYLAKRTGRNRVCQSSELDYPVVPREPDGSSENKQ
jgi:diguanylate cyclase (GGDEF)-like protein